VLSEEDYADVMNENLPLKKRIAAFMRRLQWLRTHTGKAYQQMLQIVADLGGMGIVVVRPGIEESPHFPLVTG
jgi:hypothetical protein